MKTKVCKGCGKRRLVKFFHSHPSSRDGFAGKCKDCKREQTRARRAADPERARELERAKYRRNPKTSHRKAMAYHKRRLAKDPVFRRAFNSWKKNKKRKCIPKWVGFYADILPIYRQFHKEHDPETYTLDHIVPIKGVLVCGLHVPENLQILTHKANSHKGNEWDGVRGYRKDAEKLLGL